MAKKKTADAQSSGGASVRASHPSVAAKAREDARSGKVIVPLTVKDILEEQLARKLA